MKNYKKIYEDVFSIDHDASRVKLNLDAVKIRGMEFDPYVELFGNFLKDFYLNLFNYCVKLSWLRRIFCYHGKKTSLPMMKNGILLNLAFVKILRRIVGRDIQIITRGKFFSQIESYFKDFYPGFLDGNPFENPEYYKFPYKNISIDFLFIVHQLDDRLELLKEADDKKMSYSTFVDFAINHALSKNDELGKQRYILNKQVNYAFYIVDTKKIKAKKRIKNV